MNYYKVTAKCGHVGKGMYCIKNFYVKAEGKNDARKIVRDKPRVKKSMRDCIVDVHRISYNAYLDGQDEWHSDPYFQFRSDEDMKKAIENGYKINKIKMSGRFSGKSFIKRPKKYNNLYRGK